MRTVHPTVAAEIRSQNIGAVFCAVVTIAAGDDLITLTDNTEEILRAGAVYAPWNMRYRPGPQGPDRQQSGQLAIGNVDQSIAAMLRPLDSAPEMKVEVVRIEPAANSIVTVDGVPVTVDGEVVTVSATDGAPWQVHSVVTAPRVQAARNLTIEATTLTADLSARVVYADERFPPVRHDGRFRGLFP